MNAIVKSVPINQGLNHWIGQTVKIVSSKNFSFGKLFQIENKDGLRCELLGDRLTFNLN